MATSFDTIIDRGLITVSDYKLVKLYNQDFNAFQKRCDSYLVSAVPNFVQCRQDLSYNLETREFNADLTESEISILADMWQLEWFDGEVQISSAFANALQTAGSFKTHSPAQNLKEKSTYQDKMREKIAQRITQYQLEDIDNIEI